MLGHPIHPIDLAIIFAYLIGILVICLVVARRTKSGEDLFFAGRSLGWIPIGFSLFASNISSTTLIGLAGQAYKTGISVSNYEWMAAVVLVFMAIFVIPLYFSNKISTIPEFLGKRFDSATRRYFSIITIFLSIMVDTAGGLYAGALVLKVFFPGLVVWQVCIALAAFAGIYTAVGGLKAVVYTDVLQAVVLMIGCACMTLILFSDYGFSWTQAMAPVPKSHLSLIRPLTDPALPWLGTLIGVPVLGFYYWITNQYIVQRVLGARSLADARWGAMLGGLLKLPVLFFMVIPGVMAIHAFPTLNNPDLVFPTIITKLLPVGFVGLVLAALIAAIMSSIDSTLNSASTLIVLDFLKPKYPNLTPTDIRKYGRRTTLVLMLVAALWAPQIQNFPGLFAYLQQMFSYIVPPVVAIFVLGIFWPKGSNRAGFPTLILGHSLSLLVFILIQRGVFHLHFTIVAGILTAACAFIFVVTTVLLPSTAIQADIKPFLFSRQKARPSKPFPFYLDYRFHCLALMLLTLSLVITFW